MAMLDKHKSRFEGRARVVARALEQRVRTTGRRRPTRSPQRILIAHHLLLGDTLMLTPLLAKVREQHPSADVVMLMSPHYVPLYARRPYGVRAIGWNPRAPEASAAWREGDFDLAIIPGDNRFSWLALALGSRWIVAFEGDRPAPKSWVIDELRDYPATPAAWGDMAATLIDGEAPAPFSTADWQPPIADPFAMPSGPYAVLHVGASTPLKHWDATRWATLAAWFAERGIEPVWSAGHGESVTVDACDPQRRFRSYAGGLGLAQMWHLLAGAAVLVAPDTGVAHLGRIVGAPTVALFGPGSALICGAGDFWRDARYRAVAVDPFPCRDQQSLFKREIAWVRRCGRSPAECPQPLCMDAISVDSVRAAVIELTSA
jgi:ADP-heptose:LPS heptosyltransferase